jgi:uncharacterized damage-inducible protein DinB
LDEAMLGSVGVTHVRYHQWATGRVLEETVPLPADQLVKTLGGSFASVYATLVHLYQADCIWLDRLNGVPTGQLAHYEAPGCTYDLRNAWTEMLAKMVAGAEGLSENDWLREMSYKTLAGVPYETPLWQMVLHIVNHGSHHRGQITSMLRQLGVKPLNLDLIAFYGNKPLVPEPQR